MSTQITNAFIEQWSSDVHIAYEQAGSVLRPYVTTQNVTGEKAHFHTLGRITAQPKTTIGLELAASNPAHDIVSCDMNSYFAKIYLDDLEQAKSNADFRRLFIEDTANALGIQTDEIIIAALSANNTDIATQAGALDYAKLVEALEILNTNYAPRNDRIFVYNAKVLSQALNEDKFINNDFTTVRAIQTGELSNALGFKWVMSNKLDVNNLDGTGAAQANTAHCFAYVKPAIGLGINRDIKTEIGRVYDKSVWSFTSTMTLGSVVIRPEGVVEVPCVVS